MATGQPLSKIQDYLLLLLQLRSQITDDYVLWIQLYTTEDNLWSKASFIVLDIDRRGKKLQYFNIKRGKLKNRLYDLFPTSEGKRGGKEFQNLPYLFLV